MRGFTKLKKKHLLKISAIYLIAKAEICQDPFTWSQDDQTLLIKKVKSIQRIKKQIITVFFYILFKLSGLWKPNEDKGECGEKVNFDQLLGGSITKLGEITFMALLGYEKLPGQIFYTCGASIINKWYVLTAAHCIENDLR